MQKTVFNYYNMDSCAKMIVDFVAVVSREVAADVVLLFLSFPLAAASAAENAAKFSLVVLFPPEAVEFSFFSSSASKSRSCL